MNLHPHVGTPVAEQVQLHPRAPSLAVQLPPAHWALQEPKLAEAAAALCAVNASIAAPTPNTVALPSMNRRIVRPPEVVELPCRGVRAATLHYLVMSR